MEQKYIILIFILVCIFIIINNQPKILNNEKVTVIIPIRDREKHLRKILPSITRLLKYQKINYNIIIIEQSRGKSFNKGKLNNSAFLESIKRFSPKHILFTDVDNIPINKNSYILELNDNNIFKHYYGYSNCLGGIFSCSVKTFYKVNGFSNKYWGWGQEDDDINHRADIMNIEIDRDDLLKLTSYNRIERSNQALVMKILDIENLDDEKVKHKHNKPINYNRDILKDRVESYKKNKYNILSDGIDQCNYKILSTKYIPKYRALRILVDI